MSILRSGELVLRGVLRGEQSGDANVVRKISGSFYDLDLLRSSFHE